MRLYLYEAYTELSVRRPEQEHELFLVARWMAGESSPCLSAAHSLNTDDSRFQDLALLVEDTPGEPQSRQYRPICVEHLGLLCKG